MVRIDKIRLKNFLNIKDSEYKFDLINIISGSNGSGKSAISSEAIYYAIYGYSLRANKVQSLLNVDAAINDEEGYVEVDFVISKEKTFNYIIRIKREISGYRRLFLTVGVEKEGIIRFEEEEIEKILNKEEFLKYKNFIIAINDYRKRDIVKSLEESLNLKKSFFTKINLHSPFSESPIPQGRSISNDEILSAVFYEFKFIDVVDDFLNEKIKELQQEEKVIKTQHAKLNKILKQTEEKEKEKKYISELNNKYQTLIEEKANLEKKYKLIEEKIKQLNEKKEKLLEYLEKINTDISSKVSKEQNLIGKLSIIKKDFNQTEKIKTQTNCPVCKQKINIKVIESYLKKLKEEEKSILTTINNVKAEISKLKEKESKIKKKIDLLTNKIKELEKSEKQLKQKIHKIELEATKIFTKIKEAKKSNSSEIEKKLKNEINELEKEYKNVHKELKKYNELKIIFGKNSKYISLFVLYKIKEFEKIFESVLKEILGENISCDFSLENDKAKLKVNGLDYSNFSTSERKRIDIAYIIAIFLFSIKNNITAPILILDEYFDNMDKDVMINTFNYVLNTAKKLQIQLIITTNMLDILLEYLDLDLNEINIIELNQSR